MRAISGIKTLLLALAQWVVVGSAGAGYAEPPSWDPMLMLRVSIDAQTNLVVATTPAIIRLQPAPGSTSAETRSYAPETISFDPAARWAVLNGTAYSRVLGWYDEGTTGANGDNFYDTYARELGGHRVWIEKIGGSPELRTYAVSEAEDPTGPYTPIFGTEGSPRRWCWDGFMAHNVYAVPLTCLAVSNQVFTATYRIYVGDGVGNAVPGYGEATTTWSWRGPAVPFRPALKGGRRVVVAWPAGSAAYVLESTGPGVLPVWMAITNAPVLWEGKKVVILDSGAADRQFRLRLVP
jgi:hypothetical protein